MLSASSGVVPFSEKRKKGQQSHGESTFLHVVESLFQGALDRQLRSGLLGKPRKIKHTGMSHIVSVAKSPMDGWKASKMPKGGGRAQSVVIGT